MTDKKKSSSSASGTDKKSAAQSAVGNESWRKWKVKPDLVFIPARDDSILHRETEAGIGKRIAYCRGQLDNLSVEALSRYTKNFDENGISRMSIIRYEAGDSLPGARELRILCNALWVSPTWLLTGYVDPKDKEQSDIETALRDFIFKVINVGHTGGFGDLLRNSEQLEIEERQRWIDEARKSKQK